jgi:hypothetical protein
MQRLLSLQSALNIPKKFSNTSTFSSLFHSHLYKTFSSLTKPNIQAQNQLLSTFLFHPLHHLVQSHDSHSWHSFSRKTVHGFLSNPVITKLLLMDSPHTLSRVSSMSLADCRVPFLRAQLHKHIFEVKPNYDSHRRDSR